MKDLKLDHQGAWIIGPDGSLAFKVEAGGGYILQLSDRMAIAKRIVACVNACAGVHTDVLNAYTVLEKLREKDAQRDELLAALEAVVTISDRKHDAWDRAKEAIARAKGGAA